MRGFPDQRVSAGELVKAEGEKLIGRTVLTPSWEETFGDGAFPGGKVVITQLLHDPNAPEIVFEVEHPTFGLCGIFENEEVCLA